LSEPRSTEALAREIRVAESADFDAIAGLLARTLPRWSRYRDPSAVWHWKHVENPFGASRVLVAVQRDRVIGANAMMSWRVRRGGEHLAAMRSVDLATERAFQRSGVASEIAVRGFVELRAMGQPVGFYTPNASSFRLANRDGRRAAGALAPQVLVKRPLRALRAWWRARRNPEAERGAEALSALRRDAMPAESLLRDERKSVESLLEADAARDTSHFRSAHTWESLCWRYAQHPELRYWAVAAQRGGQLDGLLIFRPEDHYGARRIALEDLWLRRDDEATLRALRSELAAVTSADLVQAHFPSAIARSLLGAGPRFRGKGHQLVIRVMDPALADAPFARESWRLTLGDLREI
jgi:hypothetical protein